LALPVTPDAATAKWKVSNQRSESARRKGVASSIFVSVNRVDFCLLVPAFYLRREQPSFLLILITFLDIPSPATTVLEDLLER
jgi:hypothetical protein